MNLADEIDESLPGFWHSLLRPVSELKLPDGPRLTILINTQANGDRYCWTFMQKLMQSVLL